MNMSRGRCCWCKTEILAHQDYAVLVAFKGVCSHSACFPCLCAELAINPATQSVRCPICDTAISEHVEKRIGCIEKSVVHKMPIARDCYSNPSKEKDPYRYFVKEQVNQIGQTLLYFAHTTEKGRLMTANAVIKKNGEFQDVESQEAVIRWARELGRAFFRHGKGFSEIFNGDDLQSLENYAIETCSNPGFRFLCNFVNDVPLEDLRKDVSKLTAFDKSDILSCFVAHSMIQQTLSNQASKKHKRPSALQNTLGTFLYSFGCQKKVFEVLLKWRISSSISHLKRADAAGNADYLDHEFLAPAPFDLAVPCHDNLEFLWPNCGMKQAGVAKKEHVQSWTVQTFKLVRSDDPILKPCYDGTLNSVPTTLDEIIDRNDDSYTEIFGIRTEDYKKLAFFRMKHIDYFITHQFPKVEDCEALRFARLKDAPLRNMGIDVRAQKKRDKTCNRIDFELRSYSPNSRHDDYEEIDRAHHGLLDRNGMIVDLPLKLGLGETKTVMSYFNQYLSISESQTRAFEISTTEEEKIPLASKYSFYVADGSPIYASHGLKDAEKKKESTRLDPIRPFPGVFHYMKEIILLKSKLLEEFEREYIELYRPTKDAQEHVLKPKDPREFEKEAVPYVAAKYRSAIEEFANFSGKAEFSAAEVDQYMLEEAKKKWYCHLERDDLTLHEIYFMIRDSVKVNDSELFFSAVRLSLPMLFVTNAFHYVRIGYELLLWRATASEEEVYLFEELAFTRQTEFGEFMAVDLCQEKVNKLFRDKLGKTVLPQHERKMANRAIELNINATKPTEKKPTPPRFNEKQVHAGWEEVYTTIRKHLHEKRVWKRNSSVRNCVKGKWIDVENNFVTAPSGKTMSNEVMDWITRGTNRSLDYYSSFYEVPRLRHQVQRSQKPETGGVSTKKIITTEADYRNWSEKLIALKTSLDKKALKKAADGTKEKIKNAIEYTCSLMDDPDVDLKSLPDNLELLITELVKVRQKWVADEIANKGTSQQQLQQTIADKERRRHAYTSKKKREDHFDKTEFFYVTHPDVSSKFRMKRKLKFYEPLDKST